MINHKRLSRTTIALFVVSCTLGCAVRQEKRPIPFSSRVAGSGPLLEANRAHELISSLGEAQSAEGLERKAKQITALGPSVMPDLYMAFHSPNPVMRKNVSGVLRELREDAVLYLVAVLDSADAGERTTATYALSGMGPAAGGAAPALISALRDNEISVRQGAANALGAIHATSREAVEALVHALKDEHLNVRGHAAYSLGEIGAHPRLAVPPLLAALDDDCYSVRRWSAWALGRIGYNTVEVVTALQIASDDPHDDVRKQATLALEILAAGKR